MSDNVDRMLESALEDFNEEESKQDLNSKTIRQEIADFEHSNSEDPDIENLMNELAEKLDNNQDLTNQIERLGQELLEHDILKNSMIDIRDRLKDYLLRNRHMISKKELSRYEIQMKTYNEICEALENTNGKSVMELVSKLSLYGELPEEIRPYTSFNCSTF